ANRAAIGVPDRSVVQERKARDAVHVGTPEVAPRLRIRIERSQGQGKTRTVRLERLEERFGLEHGRVFVLDAVCPGSELEPERVAGGHEPELRTRGGPLLLIEGLDLAAAAIHDACILSDAKARGPPG